MLSKRLHCTGSPLTRSHLLAGSTGLAHSAGLAHRASGVALKGCAAADRAGTLRTRNMRARQGTAARKTSLTRRAATQHNPSSRICARIAHGVALQRRRAKRERPQGQWPLRAAHQRAASPSDGRPIHAMLPAAGCRQPLRSSGRSSAPRRAPRARPPARNAQGALLAPRRAAVPRLRARQPPLARSRAAAALSAKQGRARKKRKMRPR
jgi:hypothetical protein